MLIFEHALGGKVTCGYSGAAPTDRRRRIATPELLLLGCAYIVLAPLFLINKYAMHDRQGGVCHSAPVVGALPNVVLGRVTLAQLSASVEV